jgi:hypothetical protein
MKKLFRSFARWPEGTLVAPENGRQETTDEHHTEDEARGSVKLLRRYGFGGDMTIFPLASHIIPLCEVTEQPHVYALSNFGDKSHVCIHCGKTLEQDP